LRNFEKIRIAHIFVLALIILLFLSGCKSDQLKTLESSLSTIQLTTGREVSRYARDRSEGFTGPIYANIRLEFEPINQYSKKDVYDEIVAYLEENNWEEDECNGCSSGYFSASLPQDPYPIPLSVEVLLHADENLVSISITNFKP